MRYVSTVMTTAPCTSLQPPGYSQASRRLARGGAGRSGLCTGGGSGGATSAPTYWLFGSSGTSPAGAYVAGISFSWLAGWLVGLVGDLSGCCASCLVLGTANGRTSNLVHPDLTCRSMRCQSQCSSTPGSGHTRPSDSSCLPTCLAYKCVTGYTYSIPPPPHPAQHGCCQVNQLRVIHTRGRQHQSRPRVVGGHKGAQRVRGDGGQCWEIRDERGGQTTLRSVHCEGHVGHLLHEMGKGVQLLMTSNDFLIFVSLVHCGCAARQ
jgi:hypothetical protein